MAIPAGCQSIQSKLDLPNTRPTALQTQLNHAARQEKPGRWRTSSPIVLPPGVTTKIPHEIFARGEARVIASSLYGDRSRAS